MKHFFALACLLAIAAGVAPRTWSVAVDSRTTDQWMAEAPGRVYVEIGGRLAALDSANGGVLWSTSVPTSGEPAVAKDALAVASSANLLFVDAQTGKVRAQTVAAQSIAGSSSYVVAQARDGTLRGYDGYGRVAWTMRPGDPLQRLASLGGNLVAAFGWSQALFIDASDGKAVASASNVDELVGSDGRYVWFTVTGGGIKGLDLNTNRSFAIHNQIERGQVRVEHARAIAVVDGRLTIIDLRMRTSSPFHVYGRWIGGPVNDTIFIERGDGLYVQRLDPGARPVKISAYESEARYTTSDRTTGYVGLRNGTLLVVDMVHQRLLKRVSTGCDFYEGLTTSGSTAIVHCDAGTSSRIVGFQRLTPS